MIERLLPVAVVAVDATEDFGTAQLLPEEIKAIANAVAKRQAEFGTVRNCARRALAELGVAAGPILPGVRGAPSWPVGIVGSMTHCDGYRAAAVARTSEVIGLGIDAEPHAPLPVGVLELIARPEELAQLAELGSTAHWDRLLFSIKEAVYKTWFPLTGQWLDFAGVSVWIDPAAGRFQARLQVPGPVIDGAELASFEGSFLIERDLVLTATVLLRGGGIAGQPPRY